MSRPAAPGVGRRAAALVPLAIAARGAAFVVPLVIARWFGAGSVTDAWFWALALPTFALVLASTAIGTAATPAFAKVRAHAPERLPRVVGGLAAWVALGSAALGAAVAAAGPALLAHHTAFPTDTQALAGGYLWALVPFLAATGAGAVLRSACEVHGRFGAVAATPLLRAAVVIATTWGLLGPLGPRALPWGLLAGEIAQVALWAAILRGEGLRLDPRPWLDPEVRAVGRDLWPILGGEVLVALNLVVDKAFAAVLPEGSVATLEYADRARVIPQTLLESTLLMVGFATWARLRAEGAPEAARAEVDRSLRWTAALAAPPVAGMFIGRHILVQLLYERGAFTPDDTARTAAALACYLPGVVPGLLGLMAVRAHVLERNLRLVPALGLLSVVGNAALNAALIGPLGLNGLALATSLNLLLVPGIALLRLRAAVPLDPRAWARTAALVALSAGVAAAVELGPGAPQGWADPALWVGAVACFGLLGLASRLNP